jgi:FkbM family methyltransferase
MNSLCIFLKYARYRYILYRLFLRIKMGKKERDDYLTKLRLSPIDFLPERPYVMDCGAKAMPRKGSRDFAMLFVTRELEILSNLTMEENEIFVDVGANAGAYTLMIANNYKDKGVRVISIEAHPENYKALCRNIHLNKFRNVKTINKAASDHDGIISLYERSHDGSRVDTELYSISNTTVLDRTNVIHPEGRSLQLECDTLDNMLADQRADVMKMDIEAAEVLALKGAANTLRKMRKLIVEIHGGNRPIIEQILREHGFHIQFIDKNMAHLMAFKDSVGKR